MTKEEKNQLAEENLGLIYAVINKKFNFENVTEEDKKNYFEEGMIGLAIAINNYDTSVDSKFSVKFLSSIRSLKLSCNTSSCILLLANSLTSTVSFSFKV